jgi:hypothetical protein
MKYFSLSRENATATSSFNDDYPLQSGREGRVSGLTLSGRKSDAGVKRKCCLLTQKATGNLP